jgi:hypothetical protein
MQKQLNTNRLDLHLLLHTKNGLEATFEFLNEHGIGTRKWLHRTNNDDDDPENRRWNGLDIGWGRLNENEDGDEGESGED